MGYKFFGSLSIVVGVFICFAGSCFLLFDAGMIAIIGLAIGIALIAGGIHMVRQGRTRSVDERSNQPDDD